MNDHDKALEAKEQEKRRQNKAAADKLAKEAGFDYTVYGREWKGYSVYGGCRIKEEEPIEIVGLPFKGVILVKDGIARLASDDEGYDYCLSAFTSSS